MNINIHEIEIREIKDPEMDYTHKRFQIDLKFSPEFLQEVIAYEGKQIEEIIDQIGDMTQHELVSYLKKRHKKSIQEKTNFGKKV